MRPDSELSHISSSSASASPFKLESRQACATASRCGQCRGSCGNAGFHRDDAALAGSPAAGLTGLSGQRVQAAAIALPLPDSTEQLSWLSERPWIWFWVTFLVLIAAWTSFIVLAVKHQPAAISIKASPARGHD